MLHNEYGCVALLAQVYQSIDYKKPNVLGINSYRLVCTYLNTLYQILCCLK